MESDTAIGTGEHVSLVSYDESRDATPTIVNDAAAYLDSNGTSDSHQTSYDDVTPEVNGYLSAHSHVNSPLQGHNISSGPATPIEYTTSRQPLKYIPRLTLRSHKRGVSAVKFSPDGKFIASCSADCTIKIWLASTGELQHTLQGHLAGVSTIAWAPDSRILASGSDDKAIRLWDVETGTARPTALLGHHNYIYSIAFSPKGNMLVSGSYDEAVFIWDVRTARVMRSLPAHSDPVSGVDFVRDGTLAASCSSDRLIRIWDTTTGQCLKTLVHEENVAVTSVRFSPNGKYVLSAALDSSLRLWDYVEGRCVKTYLGHCNQKYSIAACFGTVDGRDGRRETAYVACGDEDGKVFLWDVSSKEVLQVLFGHEDVVLGIDVNAVDSELVTCGLDGTVRVWTLHDAH